MFPTRAARVIQCDAAVTPGRSVFDKTTDRFEYFRHRVAFCHQFEQLLFTGEQSVSTLPVVDVGLQEVPKDDAPDRISQGEAVRVEPAVDPVSTAEAGLNVVRMAGFDRSPPRGKDIGEVIQMNGVGDRPTLQFVERSAEIFQDLAVGDFDLTGRCHESGEARNVIADRAKMMLARRRRKPPMRTLGFLRPPSVLDVGVHSAPFDDRPGCVG